MRFAFLNELRRTGRAIRRDYLESVETWEEKPKFDIQISLSPVNAPGPSVSVTTSDPLFKMIDLGTEGPYPIFAGIYTGKSEAEVLAFSSEFAPKTSPSSPLKPGEGNVGDVDTLRPYVNHPGIEAREITKALRDKWEPIFKGRAERIMRDVRRASGHAI